jgi:hypothetical protein
MYSYHVSLSFDHDGPQESVVPWRVDPMDYFLQERPDGGHRLGHQQGAEAGLKQQPHVTRTVLKI